MATVFRDEREREELRTLLAKLRADGSLIREKAKTLLEHLGLDECFAALTDPDLPRSQKLETIKYLTRLADMEPKPNALPTSGEKFSISIVMPQVTGPPPSVTIDARPIPPDTLEGRYGEQPEQLVLEPEPEPETPQPLRVRDFDIGKP